MDEGNSPPNRRPLNPSKFQQAKRKPRRRLIAAICMALLITGLLLVGCGGGSKAPIPTISKEPTRDDIIQAVRRSVNGKTYQDTETQQEARWHTCSQIDVDRDPYMPHNPELARCPYEGARYTTYETVTDRVTRKCKSLPDAQFGWHVEKTSDNHWRVTQSGKEWRVRKLEGGSANVGDTVRVSSFRFLITTDGPC